MARSRLSDQRSHSSGAARRHYLEFGIAGGAAGHQGLAVADPLRTAGGKHLDVSVARGDFGFTGVVDGDPETPRPLRTHREAGSVDFDIAVAGAQHTVGHDSMGQFHLVAGVFQLGQAQFGVGAKA